MDKKAKEWGCWRKWIPSTPSICRVPGFQTTFLPPPPSYVHSVSHPTPLASSTTTKIKLGNPGRRPSREPSTSSFPVSPSLGAMTVSASRTIPHAQRAFLPPLPPPGSQQGWRGSLPGLWHSRPTTTLPSCGVCVSLHPAFTTNRRRPLHPFPPRHPPPPLLGRQGRREDGISWRKTTGRWAAGWRGLRNRNRQRRE